MNIGKATRAPAAFYTFCSRQPGECARRSGRGSGKVVLNPERWSELKKVNRQVNRSVREVSDLMNFGHKDVWQLPDRKGDCEDFALLKRRRLMALGWPSSALLMTVVRDRDGGGHAVLTVVTDKGDYILDNITGRISLWSRTPYVYFSRQSQSDPRSWVSITTDVQRRFARGRR
jgi:predicted transglutaminase-like cysteine proteinase